MYKQVDANQYQRQALQTARSSAKTFDREDTLLLVGMLNLGSESGELLNILKKHLLDGHILDTRHVQEEIGDCLWSLAVIAKAVNVDLGNAMEANITKLFNRYRKDNLVQYSEEASQARIDKADEGLAIEYESVYDPLTKTTFTKARLPKTSELSK